MMVVSDIKSISNRRLLEAKKLLDFIVDKERESSLNDTIKIIKGSFFVVLYGAFEETVRSIIERCIDTINLSNTNIQEITSSLYAIGLDDELKSIQGSSPQWSKRIDLFKKIEDNNLFFAKTELMPAQQGNFKLKQIESLWNIFGLKGSPQQNDTIGSRLARLTDDRCAIAHGRKSASEVGSLYSSADMTIYYNSISLYCSFIIDSFESYINQGDFKKG